MLSSYKQTISQWRWYDVEQTTSTNDEIRKIIKEQTSSNIAVSAKKQTGGRGRRGRKWQGIDGNLYFTYSLEISSQELSRIVCLIGLSLAKTVQYFLPDKKVQIKWPNDVFLEGKKLSGILLENIENNLWAIGIGVNIVGAPSLENAPYSATSLKEQGIVLDRTEFLRYYLHNFAADLAEYTQKGFLPLKEQWLKLALNYQQKIIVKTENKTITGTFLTLDDNGYLILKTSKGEERILAGDLFI
ncbi:MAG: biotin--[acetyl-CoA-carboxylase] ligase [Acetobacter sp.]|nr:biotin--[acetyl-CoA-carboxylase] ligase [Acetobacter sp.]